MNSALLIKSDHRLSADDLAAGSAHSGKRDVRIDHPECSFDYIAAIVDLSHDPISVITPVGQK
jgi:hypothetical protein